MWHRVVKSEDVPELPSVARKMFLRFYNVAGGSITHQNDHERFNEFIRHCHARRVRLSENSMKDMLLRIGATEMQAKKLSEIYYYCRCLLKKGHSWE